MDLPNSIRSNNFSIEIISKKLLDLNGSSIGNLEGLYKGYNKIWQHANWVCKTIFNLNLENREGKQVCGEIQIHGGLVFFNFHFPENRNDFTFMIWGLMGITGNS